MTSTIIAGVPGRNLNDNIATMATEGLYAAEQMIEEENVVEVPHLISCQGFFRFRRWGIGSNQSFRRQMDFSFDGLEICTKCNYSAGYGSPISRSVCRSISAPVALSEEKTPDLAVTDMRVALGLISSNSMSIERFMDFALISSPPSTLRVEPTSICMRWSAAWAADRTLGRDAVKVRETVPPSVWDMPADTPSQRQGGDREDNNSAGHGIHRYVVRGWR